MRGLSKEDFILDTPGPTRPTLQHHADKKRQRPYFPADQDIPGSAPPVFAPEMER